MRGWILDLYPAEPGQMVLWLKLEDGSVARLVDRWSHSIFVAADSLSDAGPALDVCRDEIAWRRVVERYERITDQAMSEVVEVGVRDSKKAQAVAGRIERLAPYGKLRLYNADVPPAQAYLYDEDIFPMGLCEVREDGGRLRWKMLDGVMDYDYPLPRLRVMELETTAEKRGRIAKVSDVVKRIELKEDGAARVIEGGTEKERLLRLVEAVKEFDPDVVTTVFGDSFVFPHLLTRARANGVADEMSFDRERIVMGLPAKKGTSYFSYGQIRFKPSAMRLYGRVHIDLDISFACSEGGYQGLFELSRICRMPLHTASRASIGKALSSLQFYEAWQKGLLVPWRPTLAEHVKDRAELLLADRGGFVFEPRMGPYEGIAEMDFSSLYPNIMLKKNVSAETVLCPCCPDSKLRVPELDWNTCERQKGIVPRAMKVIVEKRLEYKRRKNDPARSEVQRGVYDQRQAMLKWVGVATFGYLGHNNAKFGRIDAHIAVCAWDRRIMVEATRVAESRGYEVIHGIVDSLWLRKPGASREDYLELRDEIQERTGFELSFEGIYRWIVFLPSRVDPSVPVLNAYFGAYQDGKLKVRGIEARRHDTPRAFKECQTEILEALAEARTLQEAASLVPRCVEVFKAYARRIKGREVPPADLAFLRFLSKKPEEYSSKTVQSAAADQLAEEGVELHAGEAVRLVLTRYRAETGRAAPLEIQDRAAKYDTGRYVELLAEACATVLKQFDPRCDKEALLAKVAAEGPLDST